LTIQRPSKGKDEKRPRTIKRKKGRSRSGGEAVESTFLQARSGLTNLKGEKPSSNPGLEGKRTRESSGKSETLESWPDMTSGVGSQKKDIAPDPKRGHQQVPRFGKEGEGCRPKGSQVQSKKSFRWERHCRPEKKGGGSRRQEESNRKRHLCSTGPSSRRRVKIEKGGKPSREGGKKGIAVQSVPQKE